MSSGPRHYRAAEELLDAAGNVERPRPEAPPTSEQAALVEAVAALRDLRRAANWAVAAADALIATDAGPSSLRNYADRLLGVERHLNAVGLRLHFAAGSEECEG